MNVDFDWDGEKNLANRKKHGIWFTEAVTIWNDEGAIEFFDLLHSEKEDRYVRVGHSNRGRLLLVVFSERQSGNVVRIISARTLTPAEESVYEERV